MHRLQWKHLIVFLNLPVKTESVRDLQERFVVVRKTIVSVLLLSFFDMAVSATPKTQGKRLGWLITLSLRFNIGNSNVVFKERDHGE